MIGFSGVRSCRRIGGVLTCPNHLPSHAADAVYDPP